LPHLRLNWAINNWKKEQLQLPEQLLQES